MKGEAHPQHKLTEEQVREILAAAFEMSAQDVGEDASTDTVPQWDSVTHLSLIIGLEEAFGISLDPEDVPLMTDFRTILEKLQKYDVSATGE